jgi:hypothetical protein
VNAATLPSRGALLPAIVDESSFPLIGFSTLADRGAYAVG